MKKIIILAIAVIAVIVFISYSKKSVALPSLSEDGKSIVQDTEVLLNIEDLAIFSFFQKAETGMCDSSNITNTASRTAFCTNPLAFKQQAKFTKLVPSVSGTDFGFVIETTELSPDTVVGMVSKTEYGNKVTLLTNYYLGNDFLSFSPSGSKFAYKERCWEAICGFTIKDTATLRTMREFGNPETDPATTFTRWIDDTSIEYVVGSESLNIAF